MEEGKEETPHLSCNVVQANDTRAHPSFGCGKSRYTTILGPTTALSCIAVNISLGHCSRKLYEKHSCFFPSPASVHPTTVVRTYNQIIYPAATFALTSMKKHPREAATVPAGAGRAWTLLLTGELSMSHMPIMMLAT